MQFVQKESTQQIADFRISCPTTELAPRTRRETCSKSCFRCQRGSQQIVVQSLHDFAVVAEKKMQHTSGSVVNVSVYSSSCVIASKLSNELKDSAAVAEMQQDVSHLLE